MGRILVVNTLIESLFVYKMQVLEPMSQNILSSIEKAIWQYVWAGKRAKIAYHSLQACKEHGGLRLVNLRKKQTALLIRWVFYDGANGFFQERMYLMLLPEIREQIWYCNLNIKHVNHFVQDSFWRDVLRAWCQYNFTIPENKSHISIQSLWLNSLILINKLPVYNKSAIIHGPRFIRDIWEDNKFITYDRMVTIFPQCKITWIQYAGVVQAIPVHWKTIMRMDENQEVQPNYECLKDKPRLSHLVYQKLILAHDNLYSKYCQWETEMGWQLQHNDFLKLFQDLYKISNNTKLRDFQYRILTRILPTNIMLHKWKMVENDTCYWCKTSRESYSHFFYKCANVKRRWNDVVKYLEAHNVNQSELEFNAKTVISNKVHAKPGNIVNLITLIVKQILYRHRCMRKRLPTMEQIVQEIEIIKDIEYNNARIKNKLFIHVNKWYMYYDEQEREQINNYNMDEI